MTSQLPFLHSSFCSRWELSLPHDKLVRVNINFLFITSVGTMLGQYYKRMCITGEYDIWGRSVLYYIQTIMPDTQGSLSSILFLIFLVRHKNSKRNKLGPDFTRLMLISTQVEVVVEVGVELGSIFQSRLGLWA